MRLQCAVLVLQLATAIDYRTKYELSDQACSPPINEDGLALFTIPDAGIRPLFSRDQRYQGYLDVEGALALAEGELGLIPKNSSLQIMRHAELGFLNRTAMIEYGKKFNHPLMPLIQAFSDGLNALDNTTHAGGWVHWGATTQNVVQTGFTLAVRRALVRNSRLLADLLRNCAVLANRSAHTVLAGRTHGQQAVPITFGFKVATWIDELTRHARRLQEGRPRLLVALMGGAVGSMASFQGRGPEVQRRVAAKLGLGVLGVPARTAQDHFAEHVAQLALLGSTCGRVGLELFELMQTELGEVEEPIIPGTVGSSTMPQKRNPNHLEDVMLHVNQLQALVGPALQAQLSTHEAMGNMPRLSSYALTEALGLAGDILADLNYTVAGLVLHKENMWYNVKILNRGLIMAERVMLVLGETLGRQTAHAVVYAAAQKAIKQKRFLNQTLWEVESVRRTLGSEGRLEELLDPASYTGESVAFSYALSWNGIVAADELLGMADQLDECDGLWELQRTIPSDDRRVAALETKCAAYAARR